MRETLVHPGEEFFRQLALAATFVRRHAEHILYPLGLTVAEYTLLRVVRNTPGITARDAQGRLFATAPSVAQLVKSVEGKGLIRRSTSSEDARVQHINLTAKGKTLADRAYALTIRDHATLQIGDARLRDATEQLASIIASLPNPSPLSYGER